MPHNAKHQQQQKAAHDKTAQAVLKAGELAIIVLVQNHRSVHNLLCIYC